MFRKFAKKVHSVEDATIGRLRRIHPVLGLVGYFGLGMLVSMIPVYVIINIVIIVGFILLVVRGEKYKKEDGEL